MAILSGKRLGPYEILSAIGAGGMGEVYRARDTRLERIVAVKILPDHLADRAELRERFEREARTIASLNHPHICTLHDIGQQDGTNFLVMEYLDGETLAERLRKGPLPLDQVLQYAIEIADALDKAHRKGITHRDLKPGNIMLTKSGTKLLDFGLAKLRQDTAPGSPLSQLPTANEGITAQGTILGTLQYMAPEQVEGKTNEIDARTDIFAFGVVVYEMATGTRAFEGKTSASVMAKIMESDPAPMSLLQPMTPTALDHIVKRCLAKEPDKRWQAASDPCAELSWILESGSQVTLPAPVIFSRDRRKRLVWSGAAALVVTASLFGTLAYFRRSPAETGVVRTSILPTSETKAEVAIAGLNPAGRLALSPDGRRLAFIAAGRDDKTQVWTRPLDALTAQPLAGTDGAAFPFWSPDSRFLAFVAQGKLKKIDASGGPAITLCDVPGAGFVGAGTWSKDNVILFTGGAGTSILRVPASGGTPVPVTILDAEIGDTRHSYPFFLPDGHHFLYVAEGSKKPASTDPRAVYIGSLDSKEKSKLLLQRGSNAKYSQGYLFFVDQAVLMAQPFDPRRLEFIGDAVPLAEDVQINGPRQMGAFSVAETGAFVYQAGSGEVRRQLVWFGRDGKSLGSVGAVGDYVDPALSRDGKKIAVSRLDPQTGIRNIWVLDAERGSASRITFDGSDDTNPIWSPDGGRIAFAQPQDLFITSASGTGKSELLQKADQPLASTSGARTEDWSLDGQFIVYADIPRGNIGLFVIPLVGERKATTFLQTPYTEFQGKFSPDGRSLAYSSNESGRYEVYVQTFPASDAKWQVSTEGGDEPRWRGDGKELYFLTLDRKLMAVDVTVDARGLHAGVPKVLFQTEITEATRPPVIHYDVRADGQRFLFNVPVEEVVPSPVTLVLNWTAGLKK